MKRSFRRSLGAALSVLLLSSSFTPVPVYALPPGGEEAAICLSPEDPASDKVECLLSAPSGIGMALSGESVTVSSDEGGQLRYYAVPGETVTLTVTAEEGYAPGEILCGGERLGTGEGSYSFEMPQAPVQVQAQRLYTVPVVTGAGLSLSFRVQTNVYLQLPAGADASGYGILLQGPNDADPLGTPLRVSDLPFVEGHGYQISYRFSARQMEETSSFSLYDRTGTCLPMFTLSEDGTLSDDTLCFSYSVSRYLDAVETLDDSYASLKNVGQALRQYGVFARRYFYGDTSDVVIPEAFQAVTAETFYPARMRTSAGFDAEAIGYCGMSLVLKSESTMRLYFSKEPTGLSVLKPDGTPVSFVSGTRNGYYTVDIPHISPNELQTMYTFVFPDAGTLTASPWSYAYLVLSGETADENLICTAKALYLYYLATAAYYEE